MKSNGKRVVFLSVLSVACTSCVSIRPRPATLPAVKIVVVDAETRKPVPNISVYYHVTSSYWDSFFGIPQFIEPCRRHLLLEKYVTNARGEVCIPAQRVWIKLLYEDIYTVEFYVNFDMECGKCSEDERYKLFVSKLSEIKVLHKYDDIVNDETYIISVLYSFFGHGKKGNIVREDEIANVWNQKIIDYGSEREKDKGTFTVDLKRIKGKRGPSLEYKGSR